MMNYKEICQQVIAITRDTAVFINKEAQAFDRSRVEYKGLNDMVSYVDKTAEQQLVKGLSALLPESGFITEEATINKKGAVYNWIIDPLDGTTNFIHGLPVYSISIALYEHDKPVVGVVYEINRDEMFSAWKGGKSYLNDKEISVSGAPLLANCLMATGFPYYQFDKQPQYMQLFGEMMQKCHGLRRLGSAAVDLAYVACGRFDGYFEYNLNAWDVAAGAFIVQQAGGLVSNFAGGDEFIEHRELVATNKHISAEVLGLIKKHFE